MKLRSTLLLLVLGAFCAVGCRFGALPCRTDHDCPDRFACDGTRNVCLPVKSPSPPAPQCTPGELRSCYTGASGTLGVGACRGGTQLCNDQGQWAACKGQILPQDETCDKIDNDCDGQIDEICPGDCPQPRWTDIGTFLPPAGSLQDIAISANGQYAFVASVEQQVGSVVMLDLNNGKPVRTFSGFQKLHGHIALSPNGKWLAIIDAYEDALNIFEVATGKRTKRITGLVSYQGSSLAFGANNRTLFAQNQARIVLQIDVETGKQVRAYIGNVEDGFVLSTNGEFMVTHGYGTLEFWKVDDGKLLHQWQGNPIRGTIGKMALNPNGQLLAIEPQGSQAPSIAIWDIQKEKVAQTLPYHQGGVGALAWRPDGRYLAASKIHRDSQQAAVTVWDVQSGRQVRSFPAKDKFYQIHALAWSGDGKTLVAGNWNQVNIWKMACE